MNITFKREVITKLDEDLQAIKSAQNKLQQKLRMIKFQKNIYREEYERLLQIANQHKVAAHNEEEYNSFSQQNGQNHSNPRNGDNFTTSCHMTNGTELPDHDHAATMMWKLKHCMSEIPHENEKEVRWRHETADNMDEDNVSITRVH